MRRALNPLTLHLRTRPGETDAVLSCDDTEFAAKIGRSGVLADGVTPAEGDGATPTGTFGLRQVYFRADRVARPKTELPIYAVRPTDRWCDDPKHPLYNRPVTAPFPASAEELWRSARSYDYCIVMDFNLTRPQPGAGSAIFFHLTREDHNPPPTEGCVAVHPDDMARILPRLTIGSQMVIGSAS